LGYSNAMAEGNKIALDGESVHEKCPTRLLDDLPVDHDAFGSHQCIAEAIAELINNGKGGKAIALIGHWGSGKSTVVRLLEREFKDNTEIVFFVFDAWGHQGDPLRRPFLERLIDWLLDKRWLSDRNKWLKKKEEIAKRVRTTRSFPRFTRAGTIMAFLAMPVPIGLGLLTLGKTVIANWPFEMQAWIVGLTILLLPFAGLILIWGLSWRFPRIRAWFAGNEIPHTDIASLLLSGKPVENLVYETPDPTSIEFQTVFKEATEEALNGNDRKLIIVVDNLDRVSTEDALKIWATLRPFFKWEESTQQPKWTERLWLLVPFAPDTPQRLWREDSQEKGGQETTQRTLADEFVEKTFQIRFHVPLPITSDWRYFFINKLKKAFPNHFQHYRGDLHAIYRIFDAKRIDNHRPPTPREVKLFINQLGAYHRVRQYIDEGEAIPLPVQCWYVLAVHDLIAKHGPEDVLVNRYEELLGEDAQRFFKHAARLQEHLAALYFNVEVDKAMQVLIGDEVREALQLGNGKRLKELQEKVPVEAFFTVVEREIFNELNDWVARDPLAIAKAALALRDLARDDSPDWRVIWQQLIDDAQKAEWSDLDEQAGKGLVTLLQKSGNRYEMLGKSLLNNLKLPLAIGKEEQKQGVYTARVDDWTKGLVLLLHEFQRSGREKLFQEFRIPGDAAFYVEVIRAAVQLEDELLLQLGPQASAGEVVKRLSDLCLNAELDELYAKVVRVLAKKGWDWSPFVDAVRQRLENPQKVKPAEIIGCLKALLYLDVEKVRTTSRVLKRLAEQGRLLHCMHFASSNEEAIGLCVLLMLEHNPEAKLASMPQGSRAKDGLRLYHSVLKRRPKNIVRHLADLTKEFRRSETLLQTAKKADQVKPFIFSVLNYLVEKELTEGYPSADFVVKHYRFLKDNLQETVLKKLLQQHIQNSSLVKAIQPFNAELADLYLQAMELSRVEEVRERLIEFLQKGLQTASKEQWAHELDTPGPLLRLVIVLMEKGEPPELEHPFYSALLDHAKRMLQGSTVPSELQNQWSRICQLLKEHLRVTLLRDIRDMLIHEADKDSTNLLELYGIELIESKVLEEEGKFDEIVRRWFLSILDRRNPQELEWLKKILKETKVFERSHEETQKAFSEAVRTVWKETVGDQVEVHLKGIASAIGLNLPKKDRPQQIDGGTESQERKED